MSTGLRESLRTMAPRARPEAGSRPPRVEALLSPPAAAVREASLALWGPERAVEIVGRSPAMEKVLERVIKMGPYNEPVLVLGESGVGKEYIAQAIYLMGSRAGKPYVSVNCPQYQEGNLTVSELFGHKRGSFTGAVSDRHGCFETANGGVIFLDEIGDLPMSAQVMLLRALATSEFQPLGSNVTKRVNVRVVAATNRTLNQLSTEKHFRRDLLFRLRYFLLEIPPLRERGEDWRLILEHYLERLHTRYGVKKRLSAASIALLESYTWPGNIRELLGLATTTYALSDGDLIEPRDFVDQLDHENQPAGSHLDQLFRKLRQEGKFWELVQEPFLERDLNRREVRRLVARGLREVGGSYRQLMDHWRMPSDQYQKFMDFLRHHRLKPRRYEEAI